jgi:hypothetical protein
VKWPVAILAVSALIITGCGATEDDQSTEVPAPTISESVSPPPTEETQPLTTPSELWQQALDNTAQANATAIEVQLITNVEGFERIVAGIGYVEMAPAFGDITWTDDLGTTREVVTANGHFLELDDTWLEIERDGALPTTVAFDPLAGLADATNVVEVGTEDVAGVPTIRLDADVNANDGTRSWVSAKRNGLSSQTPPNLRSSRQSGSILMDESFAYCGSTKHLVSMAIPSLPPTSICSPTRVRPSRSRFPRPPTPYLPPSSRLGL